MYLNYVIEGKPTRLMVGFECTITTTYICPTIASVKHVYTLKM